jgi:hypothetical protein
MAGKFSGIQIVSEDKPKKGAAPLAELDPEMAAVFDQLREVSKSDLNKTHVAPVAKADHEEFAAQLKSWAASRGVYAEKRWRNTDDQEKVYRFAISETVKGKGRGRPAGSRNKASSGSEEKK